jgi:hypothetical protein
MKKPEEKFMLVLSSRVPLPLKQRGCRVRALKSLIGFVTKVTGRTPGIRSSIPTNQAKLKSRNLILQLNQLIKGNLGERQKKGDKLFHITNFLPCK